MFGQSDGVWGGVIPSALEIGEMQDIHVVAGENASSKGIAYMTITHMDHGFARQDGLELEMMCGPLWRGMASVSEGGFNIVEESIDSTGNLSISDMQNAINNSMNHLQSHYLQLDQGDVGVGVAITEMLPRRMFH